MISDGDSVAKNAFRVALLSASPDDTPLPVNRTQELDPNDILEVRDMAEAIARAEQIVTAPRSSRRGLGEVDLFDTLGRRPTDDTAGPATPAPLPVTPTPVPASATRLMRPEAVVRGPLGTPVPPAPKPAHELVLSLPSTEEDAYFAPAGRIRSLADQTLDGYRPEPTLLLRARRRRSSYTWIIAAALLPLAALAGFAIFGRAEPVAPSTSTTTIATATMAAATSTALPPIAAAVAKPSPNTVATATPAKANAGPGVPVFDVNSLPPAKAR
jgi:hypothetical protein